MNINTMRKIDFYAGVPLTFLMTGVLKLLALIIPQKKKRPEKILFIELSEMGSTIIADPAMRKARDNFNAELFFCIFKKNRDSLLLLNTIDEKNIFVIRDDSFINIAVDTIKFLFWIRKRKIDTAIDLELFYRVSALLTGLSGAANRVGFYSFYNEGLYRGHMLTHYVAYNPHIHISKNFIALINALISDNGEVPYSKTLITDEETVLSKAIVSDDDREEMLQRIKNIFPSLDKDTHNIVLMNANASDLLPQRRWPPEKFAGLIRMVLDHDESAVVLTTGSPSEKAEMQRLADMINHERCVNFAGKVKLTELPALYFISTLMVTNDSGPGHFSSVTEMPTFVLFGPETPALYGSLGNSTPIYAGLACSPCVSAANHRNTPCRDNVCLQVITAEQVFEKIAPLLKGKSQE